MARAMATQGLLPWLAGLLEDPREYCSHLTALFLLGLSPEAPGKLTIVTPSRRRPRHRDGHDLAFVTLPPERLEPVQVIERDGCRLTVSTLEKTLVDLLAYLDLAPGLDDVADWFAALPFEPGTLLRLARHTSDTVLKRAAWLLAWSGRVGHDRIPWAHLSATPVRLDPREPERDQLWDGRFCVKFPARLLGRGLSWPPGPARPEVAEWLELRRYPAFRDGLPGHGKVPIRGDPAPRAGRFLDEWAGAFLAGLPAAALGEVLGRHARVLRHALPVDEGGRAVPLWLNRWLEGQLRRGRRPRALPAREAILDWSRAHLGDEVVAMAEAAVHLGHFLGLGRPVLDALEQKAYKVLAGGGEATIRAIAQDLLVRGGTLAPRTCVAYGQSLVRGGTPEEALALLERHLAAIRPEREPVAAGELRYAMGGIHRRLGRFDEARREFTQARDRYAAARDQRGLLMVESALGNLHLWRGQPTQARVHLRAALRLLPPRGEEEARSLLVTNLAQAEYNRGRFRHCIGLLTRAERVRGGRPPGLNDANLLVVRGKARLELGQVAAALGDLQAAREIPAVAASPGFARAVAASLAWCCHLLGQDAAARSWWNAAEAPAEATPDVRAQYAYRLLRAMARRFAGEFAEAAALYRDLLPIAPSLGLSEVEIGGIWLGIGMCEAKAGLPGAAESLARAREGLSRAPDRPEVRQANVVIRALAPEVLGKTGSDLRQDVSAIQANGVFDPFWAWYAADLANTGDPAAEAFIRFHLRRTPGAMRKALEGRVPGFTALLARPEFGRKSGPAGFTCLRPTGTRRFSAEEYRAWKAATPVETLRFDGPSGRLSMGSRKCRLKPGSLHHRIFANLLAAHPRPVRMEQLYASVWGAEFDPEFDQPTVKTALLRLRKEIRFVLPGTAVRSVGQESAWGALRLELPVRWEAVL